MAWRDYASSTPNGISFKYILRLAFIALQFIFALVVAGLYGHDLNEARKDNAGIDSRWVYAVVVAGLSALTCMVYATNLIKNRLVFGWDVILFILWVAVFGAFGKLYLPEEARGKEGGERMRNAVWVDLINMLLWFLSAVIGAILYLRDTSRLSMGTRSKV